MANPQPQPQPNTRPLYDTPIIDESGARIVDWAKSPDVQRDLRHLCDACVKAHRVNSHVKFAKTWSDLSLIEESTAESIEKYAYGVATELYNDLLEHADILANQDDPNRRRELDGAMNSALEERLSKSAVKLLLPAVYALVGTFLRCRLDKYRALDPAATLPAKIDFTFFRRASLQLDLFAAIEAAAGGTA
jgi:hypothetical protein